VLKLVFCCRRKPSLTREEFQRYWLEDHARLVRSLREAIPSMQRYVQSHTLETPMNDAVRASRGSGEPYDGITEVWIDETLLGESSEASLAAGEKLLRDESTFVDFAGSSIFYTVEHEIF
jgi:hypothetical protein